MNWPADWPAEVRQHYTGLATRWQWSSGIVAGVIANVQYLRQLTEGAGQRRYFRTTFEGTRLLWEVVEDGGEYVPIRQIEEDVNGIRRYWWGRREDEKSLLAYPTLRTDEGLEPLSAGEFLARWSSPA